MAQESLNKRTVPEFNFTFDDLLSTYSMPQREWLTKHEKTWDGLATGAMVFDPQDRLLLVQRAANDSMPNRWEVPGGSVDDEDPSVLHGCLRELWEESGLTARHVKHIITEGPDREPGTFFTNRTGKRFFCKFTFEVEVDQGAHEHVKLDPEEHQDYVWVTEEEALNARVGHRDIPLVTQQMARLIAEAFRLRKLAREKKE